MTRYARAPITSSALGRRPARPLCHTPKMPRRARTVTSGLPPAEGRRWEGFGGCAAWQGAGAGAGAGRAGGTQCAWPAACAAPLSQVQCRSPVGGVGACSSCCAPQPLGRGTGCSPCGLQPPAPHRWPTPRPTGSSLPARHQASPTPGTVPPAQTSAGRRTGPMIAGSAGTRQTRRRPRRRAPGRYPRPCMAPNPVAGDGWRPIGCMVLPRQTRWH